MSARILTAGLIGLGCVAAAAAGGYWALRSNAADFRPIPVSDPAPSAPVAPAETPVVPDPGIGAEPHAAPPTAKPPQVTKPETRNAAIEPPQNPVVPPQAPAAVDVAPAPASAPVQIAPPPPAAAPVPPSQSTPVPAPAPKYDEVTVAADSVLGLLLDSTVTSKTARVEDRVNARLSRDVLVDGRVAIASGTRLEGTVTQVERGGKFKDRPRLGIAFNALVLADGTRVAIQTETIFRDGNSPSGQASTKVGGSAVVGAILGAMIGGKKGALAGGAAGAAGGAAAVAAGDRAEAIMTSGTALTARITAPVTVLIERNHE